MSHSAALYTTQTKRFTTAVILHPCMHTFIHWRLRLPCSVPPAHQKWSHQGHFGVQLKDISTCILQGSEIKPWPSDWCTTALLPEPQQSIWLVLSYLNRVIITYTWGKMVVEWQKVITLTVRWSQQSNIFTEKGSAAAEECKFDREPLVKYWHCIHVWLFFVGFVACFFSQE